MVPWNSIWHRRVWEALSAGTWPGDNDGYNIYKFGSYLLGTETQYCTGHPCCLPKIERIMIRANSRLSNQALGGSYLDATVIRLFAVLMVNTRTMFGVCSTRVQLSTRHSGLKTSSTGIGLWTVSLHCCTLPTQYWVLRNNPVVLSSLPKVGGKFIKPAFWSPRLTWTHVTS